MKNLDNLIRLQQWKLDEKRQKVAELERLAGRLREEIDQLERELKQEKDAAARKPGASVGYGNLVDAFSARRDKLERSLAGLDKEMIQAVEDVAVAFEEFKKLDLMRSRDREKAELKRKRRQERSMIDAGLDNGRRSTLS